MDYENMTKAQLLEYCEVNGITVISKNPKKPTNDEIIACIDEATVVDTVTDSAVESEGIETDESAEAANDAFALKAAKEAEVLLTPEALQAKAEKNIQKTRAQKQKREMLPLIRVMIIDNQQSQTHKVANAIQFKGWGNRLIGYFNERIVIGKPWHVRRGCLNNMKSETIIIPVQNDDQNRIDWETMPRYSITELTPLTKDEIEVIRQRQVVRGQSVEE